MWEASNPCQFNGRGPSALDLLLIKHHILGGTEVLRQNWQPNLPVCSKAFRAFSRQFQVIPFQTSSCLLVKICKDDALRVPQLLCLMMSGLRRR